jgi:hypothetical protein
MMNSLLRFFRHRTIVHSARAILEAAFLDFDERGDGEIDEKARDGRVGVEGLNEEEGECGVGCEADERLDMECGYRSRKSAYERRG